MTMEGEKRGERLFRAIGGVGGDLIDMAEKRMFRAGLWRRWLPVAACLALVAGMGLLTWRQIWSGQVPNGRDLASPAETAQEPAAAPEEPSAPASELPAQAENGGSGEMAAQVRQRLTVKGVVYYVEAVYGQLPSKERPGSWLGTVSKADDPDLVGADVYAASDTLRSGSRFTDMPLLILVEQPEGYRFCLTYYAWDGPLYTRQEAENLYTQGKWDALAAFALADTAFEDPDQLDSEALLRLFLQTLKLEELAGRRTGDLNRYLWEQVDEFVLAPSEVTRQLDRYLEGYTFDPSQCAAYDPARDALVLQTLEPEDWARPMARRIVLEGDTMIVETEDRTCTVRLTDSGCYYESIVEVE